MCIFCKAHIRERDKLIEHQRNGLAAWNEPYEEMRAKLAEQDKALVEARAVINYYSLESRFPVDAQHTAFAKEWLLAHPAPKEG